MAFTPTRCATVAGRVTWTGDIPAVPPLEAVLASGAVPNPHAPRIDTKSHGLAGAVVFLRGIEPAVGRAWDHAPVRVDMSQQAIQVIQGDTPRSIGLVKRGDEVPMRSTAAGPFMLRARGAAFFTLAFPEPGLPLARRFDKPGLVELSSGSGQFWAAADLFVCDHPYYAVTGSDGSFVLSQVPTGEYELVAWLRNWRITGKDRDPETGLVSRLRYAAPVEKRTAVRVEPGRPTTADLSASDSDFPAR